MAIDAFHQRDAGKVFIPQARMDAEVGFSVENVLATFGGASELREHITSGRVRGIVNLVGCNNPKIVYEEAVVQVAQALIAHDVIVLTNGCAAYALLKTGYCLPEALEESGNGLREALGPHKLPPVWHMGECLDNARATGMFRAVAEATGESLKNLPLAFSSPEWSNEKGVGAALGFRLLGLNSYHCIEPPLSGSDKVSHFFYEDTYALLGSVMVVDHDPHALATRIIADLDARRSALGWQPCGPPAATKQIHGNDHVHTHGEGHDHHHHHHHHDHHHKLSSIKGDVP
jgi:carbon-monoxide dehydrogenase catalytic subunit